MTITKLHPSNDRVVISVNPKAGRRSARELVERLVGLLTGGGLSVELHEDLGEAASLANRWHAEGNLRALVGVGGDGTLAELVNRTNEGVPITVLACGTANLVAKHLGLCDRPERLCETIRAGTITQLDVGQVGGRMFLLVLGCGFDAVVVERLHAWRLARGGAHINYFSYLKPILESIRTYEYPAIQVECLDPPEGPPRDVPRSVTARWVFALNLPRYGWGLRLAPEAKAGDGLLDVYTFDRGSLWSGLRYVVAAQFGVHHHLPDCRLQRGRRFRITSEQPVAYQLDGDPGGMLPAEVELLPGRLTFVVPPSSEISGTR